MRSPTACPSAISSGAASSQRWREELGLPPDANPYYHYDLDWIVDDPQHGPVDPALRDAPGNAGRSRREDRLRGDHAQAVRLSDARNASAGKSIRFEKLERAEFDDPRRPRGGSSSGGDNQIAGVGDGFERNSPAWIDTVKSLRPDFPVYGSMMESANA